MTSGCAEQTEYTPTASPDLCLSTVSNNSPLTRVYRPHARQPACKRAVKPRLADLPRIVRPTNGQQSTRSPNTTMPTLPPFSASGGPYSEANGPQPHSSLPNQIINPQRRSNTRGFLWLAISNMHKRSDIESKTLPSPLTSSGKFLYIVYIVI